MSARALRSLARALGLVLLLATPAAGQPAEDPLQQAPPSFKEWVEGLPEGQREQALRRLGAMPAMRRDRMFRRWEAMDEGQRKRFQALLEERVQAIERGEPPPRRLEHLSPESRQKLAPLVRRWRGMGPGERLRMRQRLERFRMLSPADQQALIDKRFAQKSPEERARILESLREASKALPPHPLLDAPEAPPAPIAPAPPKD